MGKIAEKIRQAVKDERYIFSAHADEQLRDRGIVAWQVVASLEGATLLCERPRARPNPAAEFEQELPDVTRFKAVWAWVRALDIAKLVTIHFFDR